MDDILSGVNEDNKTRIRYLQHYMKTTSKSLESCQRKKKIISALYKDQEYFHAHIHLYRGVLMEFKEFVQMYQGDKPLCHTVHSHMVQLVRRFLSFFIKPEVIAKVCLHLNPKPIHPTILSCFLQSHVYTCTHAMVHAPKFGSFLTNLIFPCITVFSPHFYIFGDGWLDQV